MDNTRLAARMALCRECLGLRGSFTDTFNKCERIQRCACEPQEPKWNGFDFNRAAELCRCCATVVIPSGSRWSQFFCDGCNDRVVVYNRMVGAATIPVGRHSLMNNISLDKAAGADRLAVQEFERKFKAMFTNIERLEKHHRGHLLLALQEVPGADRGVSIADYVKQGAGLFASPQEAFEDLLRAMLVPTE